MEVSKREFREMVRLAKTSFEKTQSVTYDRYKLFNRSQETGEKLEAIQEALTAQAARAELETLEDDLIRDLFISRMKNTVLRDRLTFGAFPPDEVLKRALKFEQSKQTTQAFKKLNKMTASAGQLNGTKIKIKQQPIMAIGNKGPNSRRQTREQYDSGIKRKLCTKCGSFVDGHLKNCLAMGKTCKNCNKPNHFAKMCR